MNLDLMELFSRDNITNKVKNGPYVKKLDEYADRGNVRLLYFVDEQYLWYISIVLVLNMFLKKLKILSEIKNQSKPSSSTIKQFINVSIRLRWIH